METNYFASFISALIPSAPEFSLPHIPLSIGFNSISDLAGKKKNTDLHSNTKLNLRASITSENLSESSYRSLSNDQLIEHNDLDCYSSESEEYLGSTSRKSLQFKLVGDTDTRITLKYARQGYNLLKLALSESSAPSLKDVSFARQVYIHSLTYLIRALPPNLTTDEKISIQAALPKGFVNSPDQQTAPVPSEMRPATFLHRTLASTVVYLFILFRYILPHIQLLLTKAWAYEKEHQIILNFGRKFVESGIRLGQTMKSMGETRMGELLINILQWVMDDILGGISEGIGIIETLGRKDIVDSIYTRVDMASK